DPLADLDAVLATTARPVSHEGPPFCGGWIGSISYELGALLEPAANAAGDVGDDRGWPLIDLAWCPDALVHDRVRGVWHAVGEPPPLERKSPRCLEPLPPWMLESLPSSMSREQYVDAVARTIEYIAAGDVFQANIAQRLTVPWTPSADPGEVRQLALHALKCSGAWYGAALELTRGRVLASMSPELFLELDARTRRVTTRPIKGTRPAHVDRHQLDASAKDAAELHMIIDLMRNDLGRVCRLGSVVVEESRVIESHETVHHGVGQVSGIVRDGVEIIELLAATFPPGSITGAPKIRAMQIIDELEPVGRGPYCGVIGFLGDDGGACLNVAIRTMLIDPKHGRLDYGVGAGIVADSVPAHEYDETLAKAAILQRVWATAGGRRPPLEDGRSGVDAQAERRTTPSPPC
ncbi:MAG: anthranilate synthase component I family protein, partial [Planctomycetota bacterium]